jgi:hypothetical protein
MRPSTLPATAVKILADSLNACARLQVATVARHAADEQATARSTGYIEIARGDRRKWEFDMRTNRRAIDRMIPASIGGYPVNYGFRAADRSRTTAIRSMCSYSDRRFRPATSCAALRSV